MGVSNGPSKFQRCMELVLRGLQWHTVLIYLDEIIMVGVIIEKHLERLDEVLTHLKNAGLKPYALVFLTSRFRDIAELCMPCGSSPCKQLGIVNCIVCMFKPGDIQLHPAIGYFKN